MSLIDLPQTVIDQLDVLHLEPLKQFQFAVQIDGHPFPNALALGVHEIRGLADGVDVREVQEGGFSGRYRFPRRQQNEAITLVRGQTLSRSFWKWYDSVRSWTKGRPDYRRTCSILMLDRIVIAGEPVQYEVWRFDLFGAWPSQWIGPNLVATEEGIAFESIVLQHAGMSEGKSVFSDKTREYLSILQ